MNNILRKELLRMISWKVGIERGFDFSLGKEYKFLNQYISEDLWNDLLGTYSMNSYEEMWKSFELCLFSKSNTSFGYTSPCLGLFSPWS